MELQEYVQTSKGKMEIVLALSEILLFLWDRSTCWLTVTDEEIAKLVYASEAGCCVPRRIEPELCALLERIMQGWREVTRQLVSEVAEGVLDFVDEPEEEEEASDYPDVELM